MFGLRGVVLESDPWKGNPKTGKRVEGERSIVAGKRGEAKEFVRKPVGAVEGGEELPVSPGEHYELSGRYREATQKQVGDWEKFGRGEPVGRLKNEFGEFLRRSANRIQWEVDKFRFGDPEQISREYGRKVYVRSGVSRSTINIRFFVESIRSVDRSSEVSYEVIVKVNNKVVVDSINHPWVDKHSNKVIVVDDRVMDQLESGDCVWCAYGRKFYNVGLVSSFTARGDELVSSFVKALGERFGEPRRIGWGEGREPGDIARLISGDVRVNNGLVLEYGLASDDPLDIRGAWEHCSNNREEIGQSKFCGCFQCLSIFKPNEITKWTHEINNPYVTALCPRCGIDSVIGDKSGYPINKPEFLKVMHKKFFNISERNKTK
jgi:hypothetical protein